MTNPRDKYTVVIGLEIHAQLSTESKIYAADSTQFGSDPNTNISVISLAHPGTLPLLNKKVLDYAIKMGLACQSKITRHNIFCRKNYFYPDLPKGYQLTQDRTPICVGGTVLIRTEKGEKHVKLNRIHIEEDAGNSLHLDGQSDTFVDLNRAGVPLIEIVTEPDLDNSDEAVATMAEVRKLVRYLDICDGNMEEGSIRCDANVSIMPKGTTKLGQKVELKNMNSIKQIKNAVEHEIDRQVGILDRGEKVISETRTYDPNTGQSTGMREKEELNDYRYFPEPDLSPVVVTNEWLDEISSQLPTLPEEYRVKFSEKYSIPEYDIGVLTEVREIAAYFDEICMQTTNYKAASNWVMGPVKSLLNDNKISINEFPLKPKQVAELIAMIDEGKISYTSASRQLLSEWIKDTSETPLKVAEKLNLIQESDSDSLSKVIEEVVNKYPDKAREYNKGKKGLIGMFMGEVMKVTKGKADPKVTNQLLQEKLKLVE